MLIGALLHGSHRLSLLAIVLLSIAACAPMPERLVDHDSRLSVDQYYQMGHTQLANKQVHEAAATIDRMELIYPLYAQTSQLQLELIEGYYDAKEMDQTIMAADRFITMFPGYKDVDYAYYLRGLADFARGVTALSQMTAAPDPAYAQNSLANFTKMLERFPRSQYAANAQHYVNYLQNQLEAYEIRAQGEVPIRFAGTAVAAEPANAPVAAVDKVAVKTPEPEPVHEEKPVEPVVIQPVVVTAPVAAVAVTAPASLPVQHAGEIFYAIQVASFADLAGVKKQVAKLGLVNEVKYYMREVKGKRVYAALYGHYPTAAAAKAMMSPLQARTGLSDLWLRQRFSAESEAE